MRDDITALPRKIWQQYAARLFLGLFVVAIIILVIGGVISTQVSGRIQADTEQNLESISEAQAQHLDLWTSVVKRQTVDVSGRDFFQTDDPSTISMQLRSMMDSYTVPDNVVAIHYVNMTEKRVIASSNQDFDGASLEGRGIPYIDDPPTFYASSSIYVSQPYNSSVSDHGVTAVMSPTSSSTSNVLVFVMDVQGQAIEDENTTRQTLIVNERGRLLAHPNASRIGSEYTTLMEAGVLNDTTTGESTFVQLELDNFEEVLVGVTPMASEDWFVLTQVNQDDAYALKNQIDQFLMGLILLAVFGLGAIGMTIGRNTAMSLKQLARRAEMLRDGDFDVAFESSRSDEIGTVNDTLAEMRDSLQEQITEAEAAREEAQAEQEAAQQAREEAEQEHERMEALVGHLETQADAYHDIMDATASGDLTRRMETDSQSEAMSEIAVAFNTMATDLEATIREVQSFADTVAESSHTATASAEEVKDVSEDVSRSIQDIYDDATTQADRLERVANEMNDLSATIEEIASASDEVATMVDRAADRGETGREYAEEAIDAMDELERQAEHTTEEIVELNEQMDEIGEIVELIDGIAEQTNTLALNASIEAARAGEAGSGFAVVADEVKTLAEETREATQEVDALIESVQDQTDRSVEHIREMDDRVSEGLLTVEDALEELDAIVQSVNEANSSVQEITNTTDEQASSTQEVVTMVDELMELSDTTAERSEEVAAAAQEQASAVNEVTVTIQELSQRASDLETLVADFTVGEERDDVTPGMGGHEHASASAAGEEADDAGDADADSGQNGEGSDDAVDAGADTESVDADGDESGEVVGSDETAESEDDVDDSWESLGVEGDDAVANGGAQDENEADDVTRNDDSE
jgi:methyl-accepting chemotaxis protein